MKFKNILIYLFVVGQVGFVWGMEKDEVAAKIMQTYGITKIQYDALCSELDRSKFVTKIYSASTGKVEDGTYHGYVFASEESYLEFLHQHPGSIGNGGSGFGTGTGAGTGTGNGSGSGAGNGDGTGTGIKEGAGKGTSSGIVLPTTSASRGNVLETNGCSTIPDYRNDGGPHTAGFSPLPSQPWQAFSDSQLLKLGYIKEGDFELKDSGWLLFKRPDGFQVNTNLTRLIERDYKRIGGFTSHLPAKTAKVLKNHGISSDMIKQLNFKFIGLSQNGSKRLYSSEEPVDGYNHKKCGRGKRFKKFFIVLEIDNDLDESFTVTDKYGVSHKFDTGIGAEIGVARIDVNDSRALSKIVRPPTNVAVNAAAVAAAAAPQATTQPTVPLIQPVPAPAPYVVHKGAFLPEHAILIDTSVDTRCKLTIKSSVNSPKFAKTAYSLFDSNPAFKKIRFTENDFYLTENYNDGTLVYVAGVLIEHNDGKIEAGAIKFVIKPNSEMPEIKEVQSCLGEVNKNSTNGLATSQPTQVTSDPKNDGLASKRKDGDVSTELKFDFSKLFDGDEYVGPFDLRQYHLSKSRGQLARCSKLHVDGLQQLANGKFQVDGSATTPQQGLSSDEVQDEEMRVEQSLQKQKPLEAQHQNKADLKQQKAQEEEKPGANAKATEEEAASEEAEVKQDKAKTSKITGTNRKDYAKKYKAIVQKMSAKAAAKSKQFETLVKKGFPEDLARMKVYAPRGYNEFVKFSDKQILQREKARKKLLAEAAASAQQAGVGQQQQADVKEVKTQKTEIQAVETQTEEVQTGEVQTGEAQTGEVQTGEAQTGEAQTGEAQTGEAQTGEAQTGEVQTGEVQTGEAQTGEVQTGEAQTGEAQTGEVQTGEVQTGEVQTGEAQTGEVQTGGQATEAPAVEIQKSETQKAEVKAIDKASQKTAPSIIDRCVKTGKQTVARTLVRTAEEMGRKLFTLPFSSTHKRQRETYSLPKSKFLHSLDAGSSVPCIPDPEDQDLSYLTASEPKSQFLGSLNPDSSIPCIPDPDHQDLSYLTETEPVQMEQFTQPPQFEDFHQPSSCATPGIVMDNRAPAPPTQRRRFDSSSSSASSSTSSSSAPQVIAPTAVGMEAPAATTQQGIVIPEKFKHYIEQTKNLNDALERLAGDSPTLQNSCRLAGSLNRMAELYAGVGSEATDSIACAARYTLRYAQKIAKIFDGGYIQAGLLSFSDFGLDQLEFGAQAMSNPPEMALKIAHGIKELTIFTAKIMAIGEMSQDYPDLGIHAYNSEIRPVLQPLYDKLEAMTGPERARFIMRGMWHILGDKYLLSGYEAATLGASIPRLEQLKLATAAAQEYCSILIREQEIANRIPNFANLPAGIKSLKTPIATMSENLGKFRQIAQQKGQEFARKITTALQKNPELVEIEGSFDGAVARLVGDFEKEGAPAAEAAAKDLGSFRRGDRHVEATPTVPVNTTGTGMEKVTWINYGKHVPPKMPWKDIVKSTGNGGVARYRPDIGLDKASEIEKLERFVWETGVPVASDKPNKVWKVKKLDYICGACDGKETPYMRIEYCSGFIHGHPITEAEYMKLLKR